MHPDFKTEFCISISEVLAIIGLSVLMHVRCCVLFINLNMLKSVREYSRTRLYQTLKGNRNWFDIVGVPYIQTYILANHVKGCNIAGIF